MKAWLVCVERSDNTSADIWIDVDDPMELKGEIDKLSFACVFFADLKNGQGYSTAYLLRKGLNFQGNLRVFGDVLRDQLSLIHQVGFDSFTI